LNKYLKIIIITIIVIIVVYFFLRILGASQPPDPCNQEFYFSFVHENRSGPPIDQVKKYLYQNYDGEIDILFIKGDGIIPPEFDDPNQITWMIKINDNRVNDPVDLELMKQSLESHPKISNLTGPFHVCYDSTGKIISSSLSK